MGLPIWYAPTPSAANNATKDYEPLSAAAHARSAIRRHQHRSPQSRRVAALTRIGERMNEQTTASEARRATEITRDANDDDRRRDGMIFGGESSHPFPLSAFPAPELEPEPRNRNSRREHVARSRSRSPDRPRHFNHDDIHRQEHQDPRSVRTRTITRLRGVERLLPTATDQLRDQFTFDFAPAHPRSLSRPSYTSDSESPIDPELRRRRNRVRSSDASFRRRGNNTDGLGDRLRSLTPDLDWDPMLSTIQPDQQLPSADSSFTTAAASASFSNTQASSRSGSANSQTSSSRTHLTVPTPRNELDSLLNECLSSDGPSGSDSEASVFPTHSGPPMPLLEIENTHSSRMRRHEERYSNRAMSNENSEDWVSRRAQSHGLGNAGIITYHTDPRRTLRAMRLVRGDRALPNTVHGTRSPQAEGGSSDQDADTAAAAAHLRDPELEQMRPILGRLARRDDIPDEYWLSVGLTPVMAERVNRTERGNNRPDV
ncbi:hypothetical protein EJ05DRAFT_509315 [Pseudovirgaria hyperparasitica]|uniref:Uncharacterized protein n=1 Tax=Pseudovirgaria hyperparasitica TaxID=470096 RepID=A0A6A6WA89_9PEZI|nr:uncharacterized protein EJ05DRAFT_509315 [Pseudovirgaria hyperparasitica]KAF2759583.1 hypothetical protein EJ05DRAFT_509315 [Pseudovirgaria hyperparasitica]